MNEKSLKVTVEIIVSQAKQALADIASTTQKTSKTLEDMGASAKKGTDALIKTTTDAKAAHSGLFSSMSADITKGLAAYDLLKKGVELAFGFVKDSIEESMKAAATMAQVKVNVENAGLSYAKIGPQLDAYSQKMIKMGFDDEDTAQSVSKLAIITGNYGDALKLNHLAMDLARSKGISLADATHAVALVTQGNVKALKDYGIEMGATASVADVLNMAQNKLKGSAEAYANTTAGQLETVTQQWDNMKQAVGDELMPILSSMFSAFERNLPEIISDFKAAYEGAKDIADGIKQVGDTLGVWTAMKWYVDLVSDAIGALDSQWHVMMGDVQEAANAQQVLTKSTTDVIEKYQKLHPATKLTEESFKQLSFTQQKAIIDNVKHAETVDKTTASHKKLKDGIAETADGLGAFGDEIGKASKSSIEADKKAVQAAEEHKKKLEDLSNTYDTVIAKIHDFSFDTAADFTRFAKVLEDTKSKQDLWAKSVTQGFDALGAKIKNVNGEIETLGGKLKDTQKSFDDFLKQSISGAGDTFAGIVHDAEKAIPDLQKKLAAAQLLYNNDQAKGSDAQTLTSDSEAVAAIQKELDDKNAVIKDSQKAIYTSNQEFIDQLAALRKADTQNELQNAYDDLEKKVAIKQKETYATMAEIQKQIDAKTQERDKFILAQQAMTTAFEENVKLRQKSSDKEIGSLNALTSAVDAAATAYAVLATNAAKAGGAKSGSLTALASGGPVQGGQTYLVGEKGPELFQPGVSGNIVPNDRVSAVGSGGGVTINIINPQVRNDQDIDAIINGVEDAMSRRDELAHMGAYK